MQRRLGAWVGIHIDTLDNPGWSVEINLQRTRYEQPSDFPIIKEENSDSDWVFCRIVDSKFQGYGDSQKLLKIIQTFRSWIENC